jgi:hypothetical protein
MAVLPPRIDEDWDHDIDISDRFELRYHFHIEIEKANQLVELATWQEHPLQSNSWQFSQTPNQRLFL